MITRLILWWLGGLVAVALGVVACFVYGLVQERVESVAERLERVALALCAKDRRAVLEASISECRRSWSPDRPAQSLTDALGWPVTSVRLTRPISRALLGACNFYLGWSHIAVAFGMFGAFIVVAPTGTASGSSRVLFVVAGGLFLGPAAIAYGLAKTPFLRGRWTSTTDIADFRRDIRDLRASTAAMFAGMTVFFVASFFMLLTFSRPQLNSGWNTINAIANVFIMSPVAAGLLAEVFARRLNSATSIDAASA